MLNQSELDDHFCRQVEVSLIYLEFSVCTGKLLRQFNELVYYSNICFTMTFICKKPCH